MSYSYPSSSVFVRRNVLDTAGRLALKAQTYFSNSRRVAAVTHANISIAYQEHLFLAAEHGEVSYGYR